MVSKQVPDQAESVESSRRVLFTESIVAHPGRDVENLSGSIDVVPLRLAIENNEIPFLRGVVLRVVGMSFKVVNAEPIRLLKPDQFTERSAIRYGRHRRREILQRVVRLGELRGNFRAGRKCFFWR
ncbi:hypothetical protein [Methanoculleus submarinus]|uniref:Uncharacterized protein n=1 Tax=Methanoculleus submarinus TaxID=204050 RepID=A0AAX3E6K8_9EURY|nr:hypothetical protein [Methanoculleus submarinus]UYU17516.1 hypothetical protein OH143_07300 [Methanoculleus submarinus]